MSILYSFFRKCATKPFPSKKSYFYSAILKLNLYKTLALYYFFGLEVESDMKKPFDLMEDLELLCDLTVDDIPGGSRLFAQHVGLPSFLEIAGRFGGETIYIPSLDQLRREVRNRGIRAEYRETGEVNQLSRKYKLSERQIRNIVRSSRPHP